MLILIFGINNDKAFPATQSKNWEKTYFDQT